MENDILQYNKYIGFFTEMYNYIMDSVNEIDKTDFTPAKKDKKFDWYLGLHKNMSSTELKNQALRKLVEEIRCKKDQFIKEECQIEDMLTFSSIWQFCQFVRYAEKTIFYPNKLENDFYVDSDMLELQSRKLSIKLYDTDIKLDLEKISDNISKHEFKTIKLNINRLYGKKMTNMFTIVDEDVKCYDSSDTYLINTVNKLLYDNMILTLVAILQHLVNIYINYEEEYD